MKNNKMKLLKKGIFRYIIDGLRKFNLFIKLIIARILVRGSENGVYYINGPDSLPPPLTKEEEAEYIANLGIDPDARNVLIEHNLRLVVYIAKKFESTGIGIEDLVSIGTIGLIKAINNLSRGSAVNSSFRIIALGNCRTDKPANEFRSRNAYAQAVIGVIGF